MDLKFFPFIELTNIKIPFISFIIFLLKRIYNYFKFDLKGYKLAMMQPFIILKANNPKNKSKEDNTLDKNITNNIRKLGDSGCIAEQNVTFSIIDNLSETESKVKSYLEQNNTKPENLSKLFSNVVSSEESKKGLASNVEKFRANIIEKLNNVINKIENIKNLDLNSLNVPDKKTYTLYIKDLNKQIEQTIELYNGQLSKDNYDSFKGHTV